MKKKSTRKSSGRIASIPVSPIDALVKKLDLLSCEMETKWGTGVLHALCTPDTSGKFIKVAHRLDEAIQGGDFDTVKREVDILIRGWRKMEEEAIEAGHSKFPHDKIWYVGHPDAELGIDYIICRHDLDAARMSALHPSKASSIFTLKDVAEMIKRESLPENLSRDKDEQIAQIMKRERKVNNDPLNDPLPF